MSQLSRLTTGHAVAVSFEVPDATPPADDHTHRRPPRRSAAWVVLPVTGEGSGFNVVAHAYNMLQNLYWRFANAESPMFSMLRCCRFSMSDVYIGRTLYDSRDVVEW